jgi:N-succinyl-L-ornithine transcarbamylase
MKQFTSVNDINSVDEMLKLAAACKANPIEQIGKNKTLGLVFFNPSLRTRLSTQKAAYNLGMNVIVMNVGEAWNIEFEDGAIMNGSSQEHIKDAVSVISSYCDIIGVRTFPGLKNADEDYSEPVLNAFLKYSDKPIISLESATLHPLQSLTDMLTIQELGITKPKVLLSWAPHPKALPHAVSNSFLEWVSKTNADITIAHPKGYELSPKYAHNIKVVNDQREAFSGADIIYCKNWSSFSDYGARPQVDKDWTIDAEKMSLTNNAHFMHCMPIRRNVIATDEVIDSSIIYNQAANRVWSAQAVLKQMLS